MVTVRPSVHWCMYCLSYESAKYPMVCRAKCFQLWPTVMLSDGHLVDTAHLWSQQCVLSEAMHCISL